MTQKGRILPLFLSQNRDTAVLFLSYLQTLFPIIFSVGLCLAYACNFAYIRWFGVFNDDGDVESVMAPGTPHCGDDCGAKTQPQRCAVSMPSSTSSLARPVAGGDITSTAVDKRQGDNDQFNNKEKVEGTQQLEIESSEQMHQAEEEVKEVKDEEDNKKETLAEALGNLTRIYLTMFFLLTYLVLPTVTQTIFAAFACTSVDPDHVLPGHDHEQYLTADLSIKCGTHRYYEGYYWAVGMIFVYPVGVVVSDAWLIE